MPVGLRPGRAPLPRAVADSTSDQPAGTLAELSSPEVNASRAARESGKRVLVGALTSETTELWALPEGGLPPGDHGPGWASSARRRVPRSRLGRLCRIYLISGIRRSGVPNDL